MNEPRPIRAGAFRSPRDGDSRSRVLWLWVGGAALAAAVSTGLQVGSSGAIPGQFVPVSCFLVCLIGAWIDAATRRIPNVLTYPAILLGLGLNCALFPLLNTMEAEGALEWLGSPGARSSALGFLLCAAIGILGFMSRGLGGGDVKLMAAVGAFIGAASVVPVLFNTLVIAALIGVLNWMVRGELIARVQVVSLGLMQVLATRRGIAKVYPFRKSEAPFGAALLLGLVSAPFFAVHEIVMSVLR